MSPRDARPDTLLIGISARGLKTRSRTKVPLLDSAYKRDSESGTFRDDGIFKAGVRNGEDNRALL